MTVKTIVTLDGIEPFARFVAQAARADAYFFALTADEYRALPPKAKRGIMALRKAFLGFGYTSDDGLVAVHNAQDLDPVEYGRPEATEVAKPGEPLDYRETHPQQP